MTLAITQEEALVVAINEYGSAAKQPAELHRRREAFGRYPQAAHGFTDIQQLFDRDATTQTVEEAWVAHTEPHRWLFHRIYFASAEGPLPGARRPGESQ